MDIANPTNNRSITDENHQMDAIGKIIIKQLDRETMSGTLFDRPFNAKVG